MPHILPAANAKTSCIGDKMNFNKDMKELKTRMISEIKREGNGVHADSVSVLDEPFELCGKIVRYELILKVVEKKSPEG